MLDVPLRIEVWVGLMASLGAVLDEMQQRIGPGTRSQVGCRVPGSVEVSAGRSSFLCAIVDVVCKRIEAAGRYVGIVAQIPATVKQRMWIRLLGRIG